MCSKRGGVVTRRRVCGNGAEAWAIQCGGGCGFRERRECRRTTSSSWAACCVLIGCGRLRGGRGIVFPQYSGLFRRHEGRIAEQGDQNHYTSCLFLQRFVESERDFLNYLFLTSPSTFVLYGIPLSESLLVASSILCIPFFSLACAFNLSARVPHLRCNCHHGSYFTQVRTVKICHIRNLAICYF